MTTISILSGEWEISFPDETVGSNAVAGLRMIRHISGTTVRSTNELYSAVADALDEHAAMGFPNAMLPVTPEAYTLENAYFMPSESTQYLDGGAISTSAQNGEVVSIAHNNSTPFDSDDIGRQVLAASGDTGTLLDFETLPDGTNIIWIRPDDPITDLFDAIETLEVTTDGGTGSVTSTAVSTTGEQLWSNIQVIGGIASNSEVYVVQDKIKLTQWWTTDPTVNLGIIDILVRVQRDNTLVANGQVEVFNRRYTALYDNFLLDVSGGGRSALPLATADDINNTTGYQRAQWDAGMGSTMQVGDLITNTTVSGAFAVVTDVVTDGGATGTFAYYLVGNLTDFSNDDTFTSPNRDGTINLAPVVNTGGPTDPAAGEGGTVLISLGTTTADADGDGTAEPYSMTVDARGDTTGVPLAKVYERIKYATRRGADNLDLFGAGVNMDGEQFRGAQVQVQYTSPVGTFTEGDDVFEQSATFTAINLATNVTDTYIMLTDPFDLSTLSDTDVLEDESGDTVTVDTGGVTSITPVKASPFGTSTGSQIFGARGVLFTNPAAGDEQNYIGTDDNGVLRTPPNTVAISISSATGDYIFVADDTGVAGVIDKDRFGGTAATSEGATTITVDGTIDSDVPQAGFLRIVDLSEQEEHCYRYSARTSTTFTLVQGTGTCGTGGTSTLLDNATGIDFVTADVQPGDRIYNITSGADVAFVVSVTDSNTLVTTPLSTGTWANTNTFDVGRVRTNTGTGYITGASGDEMYAPIIDRVMVAGDSGTITNTLVQSTNFGVVLNARQGKVILPFTQNGTVTASGLTLSVIRTPDTIAT